MEMRSQRQRVVGNWVSETFGPLAMKSEERVMRVMEEAFELAQAQGLSLEKLNRLMSIVYSRPPGDSHQEVGGVLMCLLAYCESQGMDADTLEQAEVSRVLSKPTEHFRRRQNEKHRLGVSIEGIPAKDSK